MTGLAIRAIDPVSRAAVMNTFKDLQGTMHEQVKGSMTMRSHQRTSIKRQKLQKKSQVETEVEQKRTEMKNSI